MSLTKETYQIDCNLPDGSQSIIYFSPTSLTDDGQIDPVELQRYLYQQLKNEGIMATEQYFIFEKQSNSFCNFVSMICKVFLYILPCLFCGCCFFYPLIERARKLIHFKHSANKTIKADSHNRIFVKLKNYNVVHTSNTKLSSRCCLFSCGSYKAKENEVAYPVGMGTNLIIIMIIISILIPTLIIQYKTVIISYFNISEYILIFICFYIMMILWFIALGRLWLIININKNLIYLRHGSCMDHCFCFKKYQFNINKFRGIRFQKQKKDNHEDNKKGIYVQLIMDDNKYNKIWTKDALYDMSYYHFIKLFRDKYPQRNDVQFSLSDNIKLQLKSCGLNDNILNESWNKEEINLEINGNQNNELKTLILFIKKENINDLVISNECNDVLFVLNHNSNIKKEIIDYYDTLKNEYSSLYPNRNTNFIEKNKFGQKILTLIAHKVKEYNINEGNNDDRTIPIPNADTIKTSLL